MSLLRRLASGALLGALGFGLAALGTVWGMPKVVNGLGLDAYAVLALLVAVQGGLLMVLSNSGQLASLVLLSGPVDAGLKRRSQALSAWTLLAAGLALLTGWVLAWEPVAAAIWKDEVLAWQWRLAAPWAGLGWACQLTTQALWAAQRARQRPVQAEAQQALVSVVFVLVAPLAVLGGLGLQGAVELQSLAWLLALIVGVVVEKRLAQDLWLFPKDERAVFVEIRRLAFWSVLALLGGALLLYADRLYSLQASPRELAAWAVATALSLRVAAGLGVLGPLLLPSLSSARQDQQRASHLQSLYLRATALLALAFFIPLAAGGAALLGAWVSPEIEARAQPWIVLLALSGLAHSLNGAYFTIQMGAEGARAAATSALGSALVGLLVGGLAQAQGLPGAAWMALAGQTVALLWRAHWLQAQDRTRHRWAWVLRSLPWLAVAAGASALLRRAGFPKNFGLTLPWVLACFVLGGLIVGAVLLGLDAWLSQRQGRASVWSQARRIVPGRAA